MRDIRGMVSRVLAAADKPLTTGEVARLAGVSKKNAKDALLRMEKARLASSEKRGRATDSLWVVTPAAAPIAPVLPADQSDQAPPPSL